MAKIAILKTKGIAHILRRTQNMRRKCPECKGDVVGFGWIGEEMYCEECGLVVQEDGIIPNSMQQKYEQSVKSPWRQTWE